MVQLFSSKFKDIPLEALLYVIAVISRIFLISIAWFITTAGEAAGFLHEPEGVFKNIKTEKSSLKGLARWDGQYYTEIAEFGYLKPEHTAFFPLYPSFINQFIHIADPVLIGVLLNNLIFFPLSSIYVYKIAALLEPEEAKVSSVGKSAFLLFLYNPATIFFSAVYTESLFSCLTFIGIFYWMKKEHFSAFTCFVMSAFTRSNGFINAGFFCYHFLDGLMRKKIYWNKISYILSCFTPFLLYQLYILWEFCAGELNIPEILLSLFSFLNPTPHKNGAAFCNDLTLPFSHVQKSNWENGFLSYWKVKKIPNFLLFAPCFIFTIRFASNNLQNFYSRYFVHAVHLSFLAFYALFFMHVEVGTRMIMSSSPILYIWYAKHHKKQFLLYGVLYTFLGLILFTNWYPWT